MRLNEEEKIENENEEGLVVTNNFESMIESSNNSNTDKTVVTNIKDVKKLFNLENKVDHLLNDCEGETIRVKEVLIKRYLKPMKDPVINEETGEILKDTEMTMSIVLVDDHDESYATGSKTFGIQLLRYFDLAKRIGTLKNGDFEPFEIKIVKQKVQNSNNKALGFELV